MNFLVVRELKVPFSWERNKFIGFLVRLGMKKVYTGSDRPYKKLGLLDSFNFLGFYCKRETISWFLLLLENGCLKGYD